MYAGQFLFRLSVSVAAVVWCCHAYKTSLEARVTGYTSSEIKVTIKVGRLEQPPRLCFKLVTTSDPKFLSQIPNMDVSILKRYLDTCNTSTTI